MTWMLTLLVLVLLGGIILLGAKSPLKKLSREEFLQELARFVDGVLEPVAEEEGEKSYRIRFKYKHEEFIYEDLEKQGFRDKVYKTYLKLITPSKLTLTFTEKKRSTRIRSDIFIASEVATQYLETKERLEVPEHLKDLKIFVNQIGEANKILGNDKISAILKKYKNVDARGYPFLSFGIVDGVAILEFHTTRSYKPNVAALRENVSSIDNYLDQLIIISRRLKEKK